MKLYQFLCLGALCLALSQSSCSNEVEVIGIWKDIPVVYGVINRNNPVNYLRVERAYLPPNESALEVAKNPDSLYFDTTDVDVSLWYINITTRDTFPWPYDFRRVTLAEEGITREDGIFANNPAYLYRVDGSVGHIHLLKIQNKKTGNTFYARTEGMNLDNTTLFTTPFYSLVPSRPIRWREFNPQGEEVYGSLLVEMTGNGFASIYDYRFRFSYKEYEVDATGAIIPGTEVDTSIIWTAASDFIPASADQTKRSINGEGFFQFLGRELSDVTGTNIRRCPGYLEVFIDGASAPLRDYINARKANEGFVGGLYPSEPYSNVEGGFGVFATAHRLERPDRAADPRLMRMSDLTYQFLSTGEFTKDKGFQAVPCF